MKIKNHGLALESHTSVPELHAVFLDEGIIFTEFRNNSQNIIEIHEVSCQFTSEDGLKPTKFINDEHVYLKPKKTRIIQIPVNFGLELKMGTNAYTISVKFKPDGSSRMKNLPFSQHRMNLIIHPRRDFHDEFFESHKIPQDTPIAKKLKYYLEKSGFKGFIAEEDVRLGINLWDEKIYPSIDQCKALIVIWTKNSQKNKKSIEREIKYAKEKNKPIIPIIEGNLTVPKIISSEKEYFKVQKITDKDLIKIVTAINKRYESGDYEE